MERWHGCRGLWTDAATGMSYVGDFSLGRFDGMGVLRTADGTYSGDFRGGRMRGQGIFTTADGRRYIGEFRDGTMAGQGRLLDAQGREVFAGRFVEGQPQGAVAAAPPALQPAAPPPIPVQPPPPPANPRPAPAVPAAARAPVPVTAPALNPLARQAVPAPANPVATAGPLPAGATLAWPAIPRGARTPIEGAFYVQRTYMMMNGGISLNHESYFFTANGRFTYLPKGGVSLPALVSQPLATRYEGSYWIEGQELVMAWAEGGKVWRSKYEGHEKSIVIGNAFASRQTPFPRGWRLEGSYQGGASIGGGTSSSSSLNFRRDGTYTRGSGVAVVTQGRSSAVTAGGTAAGAGTYEFDGFTLTLRENGVERRLTVFPFGPRDAAGRPEHIFYEGLMIKRG